MAGGSGVSGLVCAPSDGPKHANISSAGVGDQPHDLCARCPHSSRQRCHATVNISQRPPEVADRAVPGHWEGDLVFGKAMSPVATLVERKTRYLMLVALPRGDHRTDAVAQALADAATTLPKQLAKTLTWDLGHEMAQHQQFTVATGVQVYFCDPKSPWQRGSNENTNGLLRQ